MLTRPFATMLAGVFSVKSLMTVLFFLLVILLYYAYKVSRFKRKLQRQYNAWRSAEYDGVDTPEFDIEEWSPEW